MGLVNHGGCRHAMAHPLGEAAQAGLGLFVCFHAFVDNCREVANPLIIVSEISSTAQPKPVPGSGSTVEDTALSITKRTSVRSDGVIPMGGLHCIISILQGSVNPLLTEYTSAGPGLDSV